jgi:membrane protease YdiL (CAAX protease family)
MSAEFEKAGSMPQSVESLTAVSVAIAIANLVVVVCMMVHMGLTNKYLLSRSGLLPRWDDIRLGVVASFFILPPVLWLATLLQQFVEYEHKVFDLIESNPVPSVFWAMALSVVAVTPIVEEFMFRMLLQGGCDRVVRRSPSLNGQASLAKNDFASPEQVSAKEVASWSWWPVVISSLAFSMLHLGQGAAPIALFFFALAVGYLYRQTGRLWPCIIVHLILNGISLAGFILQVISKGGAS